MLIKASRDEVEKRWRRVETGSARPSAARTCLTDGFKVARMRMERGEVGRKRKRARWGQCFKKPIITRYVM